MTKVKRTAADIALELLDVRTAKNELAKRDAELSAQLKKLIKKGEVQNTYKISTSYGLDVTEQSKAYSWAIQHNCVKVDLPSVDSWVKSNGHSIPDGFSLVEKERLVEIKE